MDTEIYHFNVGDFECVAISDGIFLYEPPSTRPPATIAFANAPKETLNKVLREHQIEPEKWLVFKDPFICVMVNTGSHKVLIDTGAGDFTPNTGRLIHNLQAMGIGVDDIDMVILTHGHEDHVGGNVNTQGRPAFTNARYVMWKEEWAFWNSADAEKHYDNPELAFIRQKLLPFQDKMYLIDHETEIVPGIRIIHAPGHTFGSIAVTAFSNGEQLLCVSDVFIHPMHIEYPEWHTAFDMAPDQLIKTRHLILNKTTAEKALIIASHFPFPGVGRVLKKDTGWQWQPVHIKSQ